MAMTRVMVAFFFFLALAQAELHAGLVLKGSVACLDCPSNSDLSGLQVLVKCDKVKKLAMTYSKEDGTFETQLPTDASKSTDPLTCKAKIMGGPQQLYTSAVNSVIPVTKAKESDHFTTSKPLDFYLSCPVKGRCEGKDMGFGSSKTVDLPLPREWGLAPSSYYVPFFPIIGIP
ncbi:hypothetical protein CDL12_06582 [Handroanthus impetiginosus]|uniref:Uncharacterized protein n=1 Tax=Handroanthus impetiginosus TaxID=429701 RepID=A0A2G9HTV3_9LAMI|nr:hypothetical protein CDL12_06582 [Handroanthus impetiginosus]